MTSKNNPSFHRILRRFKSGNVSSCSPYLCSTPEHRAWTYTNAKLYSQTVNVFVELDICLWFSNVVAFLLAAQLLFFFFFLLFFVIGMLICSYYHRQTSCVSVRGSFKRLYLSINIQRFSSKVIPPWSAYCITSYGFLLCCLINGCILFGFFVYYSTALMNFKWCAMVRSLAWSATAP